MIGYGIVFCCLVISLCCILKRENKLDVFWAITFLVLAFLVFYSSNAKALDVTDSTSGQIVVSDSSKTKSSDSNLYIQPRYYAAGGIGFFALSGVSYFFKRRWF